MMPGKLLSGSSLDTPLLQLSRECFSIMIVSVLELIPAFSSACSFGVLLFRELAASYTMA